MLLKVKRTQKTAIGLLRTNVAYEFDLKDRAQKETFDALEARGLVEKTTAKDLAKAAGKSGQVADPKNEGAGK